jgi:L-fucose dehydrogenase
MVPRSLASILKAMNLDLNEKVVIVSGGARGIGAAIVRTLSEEDAIPVIVGSNSNGAADCLVAEIRSNGKQSLHITADLCDTGNCRMVVEQTVKAFGRIGGLVNNAGVNDSIGLENGSPEKYIESINRNLTHYYSLAHFALLHLKRSKGPIVNISSKVAETGQGGTSGYASSKGGINALTREWAVELRQYGIRVNCVIPSEVWTPSYERWINAFPDREEKLKSITSRIPLGKRMTTPEEIARMVVFLLSPLSSHTTGQLIYVDGGYVHLDRAID